VRRTAVWKLLDVALAAGGALLSSHQCKIPTSVGDTVVGLPDDVLLWYDIPWPVQSREANLVHHQIVVFIFGVETAGENWFGSLIWVDGDDTGLIVAIILGPVGAYRTAIAINDAWARGDVPEGIVCELWSWSCCRCGSVHRLHGSIDPVQNIRYL